MKLGVAMPIPNHSFRYWDDAGTWSVPTAWTSSNIADTRNWTVAADGDRAGCLLVGSTCPDDSTYRLESTAKRFWNDNETTPTGQKAYYNIWTYVASLTTPGANGSVRLLLVTDSTTAFPSPQYTNLKIITATEAELTNHTGEVTMTSDATGKFCKFWFVLRDAAAISVTVDCCGVMFDPFTGDGYYELENVFSVDAPSHRYARFTSDSTTRQGNNVRHDSSGGGEKLRLTVRYQDEPLTVYENLKKFYDINHGIPGLPGLPLLIEPNLPGYPSTFMCNISEPEYPLDKQRYINNRYGGTVTFTGIWA
jgi:hypothetical protein